MGSREFLIYYFVTGTLAGAASFLIYWLSGSASFLLGASGALFAVQLAYAAFYPTAVVYVWGILPLRAPVMVLGFTAVELFSSALGLRSGVAHFTHLSGFFFGWLFFVIRYRENPFRAFFTR